MNPRYVRCERIAARVAPVFLVCALAFAASGLSRVDASAEEAFGGDVFLVMRSASPDELAARSAEAGIVLSPEWVTYVLFDQIRTPLPVEGIAPDENMGLVLTRRDEGYEPVLIGKVDTNSPVRDLLHRAGYRVADYNGWMFAAAEPADPEAFGDRRGEWIDWISKPRECDIEIDLNATQVARRAREAFEDFGGMLTGGFVDPEQLLESLDSEADRAQAEEFYREFRRGMFAVSGLLDLLAGELDSLAEIRFGVSLNEERLALHASVSAEEDTPLAGFFHADHTATPAVAEWLDAEGLIVYLLGLDHQAVYDYVEAVVQSAGGERGEAVVEYTELIRDFLRAYGRLGRVSSAGSFGFTGAEPDLLLVDEMRVTDETYRELLRLLVGSWYGEWGIEEAFEIDTVGENPVHIIKEEGEELYYSIKVGDHVFSGAIRERVVEAAARSAAGEMPHPSEATRSFEERSGLAFQAVIDHVAVLRRLEPIFGSGAAEAMAGLGMPGMKIEIARGEVHAAIEVPAGLIEALRREFNALTEMVAEEKFAFDPDE